jgi:hypothetical protein
MANEVASEVVESHIAPVSIVNLMTSGVSRAVGRGLRDQDIPRSEGGAHHPDRLS